MAIDEREAAAVATGLFGPERADARLYEVLCTTRAIRRLRPDPIPDDVLERVLSAALCAPTGGNAQPWRVLVLQSEDRKAALAEHFAATWDEYSAPGKAAMQRLPADKRGRGERVMAAGDALARDFARTPVVLAWLHDPRLLANEGEIDVQPNFLFGGSLYPAIQNLLLACRAEGLGGVITTMIWRREDAVRRALGVPDPWRLHAITPIGYPARGGHGRISRKPIGRMVYRETWGEAWR
ncbi:MAG: nitroreductase family protein [Spirochaetaceae bacterium]|nr:nitroreductase family protein [Spirochaetaceae bacterium]HPG27405.1 nitroreductase family protein [Myxococcota bacterium]